MNVVLAGGTWWSVNFIKEQAERRGLTVFWWSRMDEPESLPESCRAVLLIRGRTPRQLEQRLWNLTRGTDIPMLFGGAESWRDFEVQLRVQKIFPVALSGSASVSENNPVKEIQMPQKVQPSSAKPVTPVQSSTLTRMTKEEAYSEWVREALWENPRISNKELVDLLRHKSCVAFGQGPGSAARFDDKLFTRIRRELGVVAKTGRKTKAVTAPVPKDDVAPLASHSNASDSAATTGLVSDPQAQTTAALQALITAMKNEGVLRVTVTREGAVEMSLEVVSVVTKTFVL